MEPLGITWDALGQPVATMAATMGGGWLLKNRGNLKKTKLGLSVAAVSLAATGLWTWQEVAAGAALAPMLPGAVIEAGWNWLASMGAHQFLKTAKQEVEAKKAGA